MTSLTRARVCFAAREEYRLRTEGSQEITAEPSGKLRAFDELPCVGDWVQARILGDFALIEAVEPRRTAFVRKAAGRAHRAQCVAANVDVAFLVAGLDHDLNLRRLERYLVLASESGARPVVVLNKADLREPPPLELNIPGIPVIALSALATAAPLMDFLAPGTTAVLLGSSGAGKSTIANALVGQQALATQAVRPHDSRGRHTTTARMLLPLPGGAWLIDTPGMRELGLAACDENALDSVFPEIDRMAQRCRYADCAHQSEPGCAIQAALASGALPAERWQSFLKLRAEMRYQARATDQRAALEEKRRWKVIHKAMRKRR
jgi:ribosome biogenesis GTPase / thiamine phosphate phosphatase